MSGIFADNAPRFWAAGLPVIPLVAAQKRPSIAGWSRYGTEMPDADEQRVWLERMGDGNIGLPMGPCSGLIAVDIDLPDQKVMNIINTVLPVTPWRRYGKKGEVRVYRYSGEATQRLIDRDLGTICEFLGVGAQIVLPPSIHPDTGLAYRESCDLVEAVEAGKIPVLPNGVVGLIQDLLNEAGYEVGSSRGAKALSYVSMGARDSTMVYHAGFLSRMVIKGERSLKQALGEIEIWVNNYVEQVEGDPLDPVKAQKKLVEFLIKDVTGILQKPLPPGWDDELTDDEKEKLGVAEFGEEQEIWPVGRILEDATAKLASDEGVDVDDVLREALLRASRAGDGMSALDEERLVKTLSAMTKGIQSVTSLRRYLKELRKGDIAGESHNEIAEAVKAYIDQFGELRFEAGKFWQWKGACWVEYPVDEIIKIVAGEFGKFPVCRKKSDYSQIVDLLRSTARKDLQGVVLGGVNFANGFLSANMEMMPHHPDFGQTYVLPYRYMPDLAGKMPMFQEFMHDSWGHDPDYEDKMAAVQEAIGATMFCDTTEFQRAFCLYGQAQSGKSTLSAIVRAMLPRESMCAIPPQSWGDTFLPAELFGKVLNFAGELSESRTIPGDDFKKIVEGEGIQGQRKNQQPFMFKPKCAHWFNSNHLPKTNDTSEGFTRRWLFIEWNKRVPDHKKIPGLAGIIAEHEREAIVAWAVQGYVRLKKQRDYTRGESHYALADAMAANNNSVRSFFKHSLRLKFIEKAETSFMDLYNEYRGYCMGSGITKLMSSGVFAKSVEELTNAYDFKIARLKARGGGVETVYRGISVTR